MCSVSIIVPIYNADKYLVRCLESIVKQFSEDIKMEAVLINDGSNDNSESICQKYSQKYQNIRAYTIPNSGVSHARNVGLNYARGKYIIFVDADDYLLDESLRNMYLIAEEKNAFLVVGAIKKINFNGDIQSVKLSLQKDIIQNEDKEKLLFHFLENPRKYNLLRFVWGKLFVRQAIVDNGIKFDEDLAYCEDALFMMEYLNRVKCLVYCEQSVYVYCTNQVNIGSNEVFHYPLAFHRSLDILKSSLLQSKTNSREMIDKAYQDGFMQLAMASLFHLVRLHPVGTFKEKLALFRIVKSVLKQVALLGFPNDYKGEKQENLPVIMTFVRWQCAIGVIIGFKYQIYRNGKGEK